MTLKLGLLLFLFPILSFGQPGMEFNGYIKQLETIIPYNGADSLVVDHLIHNRLNFDFFTGDHFGGRVEIRNRIFYGETVRGIPFYGDFLDIDPGIVDMSFTLMNKRSLIIHSKIDRLYIEYFNEKWEIRLGRQRVNWGINTIWTPK